MTADARMKVESCELRHGRWEIRIRLPDHDIDAPRDVNISSGTWQSPDGHGLLISSPDSLDLLSLATLLTNAAENAVKESRS